MAFERGSMTVREMGRLGGLARAAKHSHEELAEWAAKGGAAGKGKKRPPYRARKQKEKQDAQLQ